MNQDSIHKLSDRDVLYNLNKIDKTITKHMFETPRINKRREHKDKRDELVHLRNMLNEEAKKRGLVE
jgi:hypothetical protein